MGLESLSFGQMRKGRRSVEHESDSLLRQFWEGNLGQYHF
jgi:hypothetical protein